MSKFQRRHYDEIARVLGDCYDWAQTREINDNQLIALAAVSNLTLAFMEMFAEDNPSFSRDRFWTAVYDYSVERQDARKKNAA